MPTPPPVPQQTPTPPPAPSPAPVVVGGGNAPLVSIPGAPQTVQELIALRVRASELSRQLSSARSRRDMLARRIDRGDPDAQGLQKQVTFLDDRILSLEKAIDQNGQLIANAAPGVLNQETSHFPVPISNFPRPRMDPTPIFIVFILFVLAPLAVGFVWRSVRRTAAPTLPAGWNEHLQRMDRLEQAVDTIAIEIERISEGQRFLTKTLADGRSAGGVPQRAPEPVAVPASGQGLEPKALGAGPMNGVPVAGRDAVAEKAGTSGK